ncbi:hypothetical protein ZYGR_0Z02380 [Zygosaccharomyces rouxii]|uniref:CAP-Gly domain-containing protein n=1 Tax=Zygosaccharomyces rouxii TaxID=4956 RepID=A0A1Q3A509_ZYGRO|nr:hypothetical protein ZYGR_0Z02380 [Zygosaccharomyces rouxii]
MVRTSVVSSLCSVTKEWDENISYLQLCQRIESFTGIEPRYMRLSFEFDDGKKLEILESSNPYPFKTYPHVSMILVEDLNENSVVNQLQNSNGTESNFHLSDEEYAKRTDSVLQWKMKNNYGRFNSDSKRSQESNKQLQQQRIAELQIDQRCSVESEGQVERRGWLRFIGRIGEINDQDIWCGVEFDDPVGKNDGSFKGHIYFGPVKTNHGGFVKPLAVKTGPEFLPMTKNDQSDDEI